MVRRTNWNNKGDRLVLDLRRNLVSEFISVRVIGTGNFRTPILVEVYFKDIDKKYTHNGDWNLIENSKEWVNRIKSWHIRKKRAEYEY